MITWIRAAADLAAAVSGAAAWITLASVLFVAVSIIFSRLYAKDLLGNQQPVDEFFTKLETPVDVEKELTTAADQGINMLTLIGAIAAGLSLLVLLLVLTPHNPDKTGIYYAVSAMLMSIGLLMFGLQRYDKPKSMMPINFRRVYRRSLRCS
jgi:hypothetical protein